MSGEGYRILLDCRRHSTALRARAFTYDQIADVLALDHPVSPLRLYRYAHGRTAADIVAAHNDLDPAGTACLREARLYDYESWPATGRRPPARTLAILARLYQTTARRLVTERVYATYRPRDRDLLDRADHRHLDTHHRPPHEAPALLGVPGTAHLPGIDQATLPGLAQIPWGLAQTAPPQPAMTSDMTHLSPCNEALAPWPLASGPGERASMNPQPPVAPGPFPGSPGGPPARFTGGSFAGASGVPLAGAADCTGLLRALTAEEADIKRRDLLFELALLLGGTPALPLLRHLPPDDRDRFATLARRHTAVDDSALDLLERLTARLWALDEELGPAKVLPVAEAKRALVDDLLRHATLTPALRTRLLRLYWSLSHLTGWSRFDLLDYEGATRRYTEGLAAAHELRNPALLAHLHGLLAHMALHQKKPTVALDHVFTAEGWAKESGNRLQQSATAIQVARAIASAKHDPHALLLLDRATDLADKSQGGSDLRHLFWLTPERVASYRTFCLIELKRPDLAISEAQRRLTAMGPDSVRERGILQLEYALALIDHREIPEAATMIGEATPIVTRHSSTRLARSAQQAYARLQPWRDNKYVVSLSEHFNRQL
ncbi:hypothetical protein [Streptosporangium pseudovulgare]|uniref:XRE family transcriptional regulator n=1 Tax=Streptosporangium pseudovulgare TaxID=35765 RepID=A0ABQ2QL11_9ACTN|nr:hypothetical protein [Streptosporangium pseudovulgare]GGP83786.1 hypothetical protein GCM10010140_10920 [Streptosporangium pseudovulgare]